MHATSVRPHTKLAAAMVAAGVVSAASVVGVPEYRGLPAINADVANASVITDALYGLGNAVNDAAYGVTLAFDGVLTLPFDALAAIAVATQNPSLSPTLLSWLVQKYVNPSDNLPVLWTYPWAIKVDSIEPLAGLLPYPLNDLVINGVNQFADAINSALAGLPNPLPGADATDAFYASDIGRTVIAANYALIAPVWALYHTASYLGFLPANLEASFESAIRNPSQIPGLVSNLVYDLLSPNGGLLGNLLNDVSLPFTTLPGPIGDVADTVVAVISGAVTGLLSLLPAPISPNPFPSALRSVEGAESFEVNSIPDSTLDVPGGISLLSTDLVENKVAATDSTVETLQDPETVQDPGTLDTPPAPPQDPAPAAGDVDPDATPAADTDATEVKADKSVTDKVKLGNKVKPGDKFANQAKGETAKGKTVKENDTTVSAPVSDGNPAGDTSDPTGPQGGESDGADNSGGASNEAAA